MLISAEGLYRTKDQRIELALNFKDLALDDLGALLPGTVPDMFVSEPMSGSIKLAMDRLFSIDAAVFDLQGKALNLADQAYIEASALWLEAHGTLAASSLKALRTAGILSSARSSIPGLQTAVAMKKVSNSPSKAPSIASITI